MDAPAAAAQAPTPQKNGEKNGERSRAVDAAILQIEKQFGRGAIMRLGDRGAMPFEVIPTGSVALDLALGVGGVPRGRITEIFGPESSGKTTLCYHVVGNAQRTAAWRPSSTPSTRSTRATPRTLGVNVDDLLVSQPDTGEQALEIAETLIRSDGVDVSSSTRWPRSCRGPRSRARWGTASSGLQARLMSQALRKLTGAVNRSQDGPRLHQPDAREDRRHVRQSRDDAGRAGP